MHRTAAVPFLALLTLSLPACCLGPSHHVETFSPPPANPGPTLAPPGAPLAEAPAVPAPGETGTPAEPSTSPAPIATPFAAAAAAAAVVPVPVSGGDERRERGAIACGDYYAGVRQGSTEGAHTHTAIVWGATSCAANTVFPLLCFGVSICSDHTPVLVRDRTRCGGEFDAGYAEAYAKAAKEHRENAILWGGVIGAGLWVALIIAVATGPHSNNTTHHDVFGHHATNGSPPAAGAPLIRF